MTPHPTDVVVDVKNNVKISNEDWFEISSALEIHHAVFYKLWQMGKPVFDESIPTACVEWDSKGKFVVFRFNPSFWKRLDLYNRLFVICHEALHIILNHGVRTKDAARVNRGATNTALDIVINHSTVNNFGFVRSRIQDWQDYCWVDTVFKDKKPLPSDDKNFEHYYNLFEKVYGDGGPGNGDGTGGCSTVDDHESLYGDSENQEDGEGGGKWDEAIDILNKELTEEEKESLKSTVNKHFQKPENTAKNQQAGSGTGGWVFLKIDKVVKKKKWETVIKKWSKKYLKEKDKDVEQWARLNRRLVMLPKDMFLPSEMEVDDEDQEKTKIKVWFFLDTSGSCYGLKDRFFKAALSLPPERFDIRLFCFDTKVEETTLESRKIYGGGGTSFSILEAEIQKEIREKGISYPEAVFVITDGYGNSIKPEMPHKWYWFITEGGTKTYIDKDCNFFNLKDYE